MVSFPIKMVIFPLTPRIPISKPWGARMMVIPPSNASISPRRCPWIYWDFGDQWPSTAAHVTSLGRKTSKLGGCCSHGISRFPKWFMMFFGWMWMRDTSHGISHGISNAFMMNLWISAHVFSVTWLENLSIIRHWAHLFHRVSNRFLLILLEISPLETYHCGWFVFFDPFEKLSSIFGHAFVPFKGPGSDTFH